MEPTQRIFWPPCRLCLPARSKRPSFAAPEESFMPIPFVAGTAGYPLNAPFAVTSAADAPATGHYDPSTGQPVVSVTNIATGFPNDFLQHYSSSTVQLFLSLPKPKMPMHEQLEHGSAAGTFRRPHIGSNLRWIHLRARNRRRRCLISPTQLRMPTVPHPRAVLYP